MRFQGTAIDESRLALSFCPGGYPDISGCFARRNEVNYLRVGDVPLIVII